MSFWRPYSIGPRHPATALLLASLGLGALHSVPDRALAAWPPGGVQICQNCQGTLPVVVADGTGGGFVAWQDTRSGNADIYAQRLTASGDIALGWPVDGVPLCTHPRAQFLGILQPAVSDGYGGLIIPWVDYRDFVSGGTLEDIYAQRVLADGSIAPGWPVDGLPVRRAPSRDDSPVLIADGEGGAFFTWYDQTNYDIYLQRITGAGKVAPGWPADALPICTLPGFQGAPQLVPDGAGGVLIAWGDLRDGPLAAYAQRVTGDGQMAPGWPANGVRIVLGLAIRGLISDGAGGAYLASATFGSFNDEDYFLHRFLGDGTLAPGWPEGGVPVCLAPDERNSLRMIADGVGGALMVWADYRDFSDDDLFALRIRPDGSRYPGWPVDGLRVTDNTALDDLPDLASDGMGGAYLTWDHYTGAVGDRVRVQHLTGAGAVAPGWPSDGAEIPSDVPAGLMRVVEDGMGGALVAWAREDYGIRALRYNADGPVPVAVSLVNAEAEPGLVRLTWYAADGAALIATVERRTETGDWERLGSMSPDRSGRLAYEDRTVTPGLRYAYRLSYSDGATVAYTSETWVTVPALRFALRGLTPNPSAGNPLVAFSLASDEPAAVELFDLHGRLVLSREVGSHGAGSHSVRLESRGRLAAGVYTMRLRQGLNVATARAVIIR